MLHVCCTSPDNTPRHGQVRAGDSGRATVLPQVSKAGEDGAAFLSAVDLGVVVVLVSGHGV